MMLDRNIINEIADNLSSFNPEQIIINSKKTMHNPDIKILVKKNEKEFVVENDLEDINDTITLIPVEQFITNASKRNQILRDLYSSATTVYT